MMMNSNFHHHHQQQQQNQNQNQNQHIQQQQNHHHVHHQHQHQNQHQHQHQQQQQQNQNIIPKVGIFWNFFETSISFHISLTNILAQLKYYAGTFGQIKQFSILLDLSNSNANISTINLIKQEIRQFGFGIQILEFNKNSNGISIGDRSDLVCKIWEFVYDNFDSSISNNLHLIIIDRFSNDSPVIKPLTCRGIKVTTLLNPIPPPPTTTTTQQQQNSNNSNNISNNVNNSNNSNNNSNNSNISPDTHHSFFSEDIGYSLNPYYETSDVLNWKSSPNSPTLSPLPSYMGQQQISNNSNNNSNSSQYQSPSTPPNSLQNSINSNNNSSNNLYISTSPISTSPISSAMTSPNSNSPITSPMSLSNSTSSISSIPSISPQHNFKPPQQQQQQSQPPPQHSLTTSLSNLSIINPNSSLSNSPNNKNLIQSPRPILNSSPILSSSYSSLNNNNNNNSNNNNNNNNINNNLSNSTNSITTINNNKIIIPQGIAENPSLQNLYTVIQGLKEDGFRPTFKVILPRLGALMGMRVQRAHFEKILEKAKNHNFNVDYSTKTIYYKDDNFGGADPHRADKSHFTPEELSEFFQVIDKSQIKVFPSRYNMVMWLTSQNLPHISKLKQGQIVELCQFAINESVVSLDENLKKSKNKQQNNNSNNN